MRIRAPFAKLASSLDADGTVNSTGFTAAFNQDVSNAGIVTIYDSTGQLPLSGNTAGDQVFVLSTSRLYIYNGSGWYNVAVVNNSPTIISVQDSDGGTTPFTLSSDGIATTITIVAQDSDGEPITYSYSADSDFGGLASISQDSSVFTITPFSQDSATTTSGTVTFTTTDGINTANSGAQTFILQFLLDYDMANSTYTRAKTSTTFNSNLDEFAWKSDGSAFMVAQYGGAYVFTCSTNWNISTSPSTTSTVFKTDIDLTNGYPMRGIYWDHNNNYVFVMHRDGPVRRYDYNTTGTRTANQTWPSGLTYDTAITRGSIDFSPDGLHLLVNADYYHRTYTLSTAWDLSTASYNNDATYINSEGSCWAKDGIGILSCTSTNIEYRPFSSGTAYDLGGGLGTTDYKYWGGTANNTNVLLQAEGVKIDNTGTELTVVHQQNPYKLVTYTVAS